MGATWIDGPRPAVRFDLMTFPFRRGPLEFAARWSFVSVRRDTDHVFGLGDPFVFTRVQLFRVFAARRHAVRGHVELVARLPTAQGKLFPFASGSQDLGAYGVLSWPALLDWHLGGGRVWAEPPDATGVGRDDVPDATHAWTQLGWRAGRLALELRADLLWFELRGHGRREVHARLRWFDPESFDVTLDAGIEVGETRDRIFDRSLALRFDMPFR